MLLIFVILVVLLFCGGGWGYRSGASYGAPMGLLGLVLVVILVILLLNGHL